MAIFLGAQHIHSYFLCARRHQLTFSFSCLIVKIAKFSILIGSALISYPDLILSVAEKFDSTLLFIDFFEYDKTYTLIGCFMTQARFVECALA